MKIFITAKPGSKKSEVKEINPTHFIVSVKEPPVQNRANRAIIELLANYFSVSPSNVEIVSGAFSKHKIIEI